MGHIYYIECSGNGLVYVGSTIRRASQRYNEHLHYLRNGNHHSSYLQRAFNKYGEAAFSQTVVEKVEDNNFLLAREQFHIWRFDKTMNGAPVSDGIYAAHAANRGRKMPNEERLNRSKILREALKNYDFSARATEVRRNALRLGWLKRKSNQQEDPRCVDWIRLYKEGNGLRQIKELSGGCRQTIRNALIHAGVFDRDRKYKRKDEWTKKAVLSKNKWINDEVSDWVKMYKEGVSIRSIEKITGRSRKVISRELKNFGLMNDSQRSDHC